MSKRPTEPLARSVSLRDGALAVIRQAIVAGEIRPGEILSAVAFAERLGVSPSPVREAMLTLVNEGLLEPVRNRGFRVIPMTEHDLEEVYQLRLMLEVPAVAALVHHDLGPHRDQLYQQVAAIEEAAANRDVQQFLEKDREFHLTLLSLGGNRRLIDTVAVLRDQTRLYGLEVLAERGMLDDSAVEHRAILDALVAGDERLVVKLMTDHLHHIRAEWSSGAPDR